jgi:hypothetical protein
MTTNVLDTTDAKPKVRRYIPFRVVCLLEALVFLVLFGMYRSWLSPWVTVPDDGDHGWTRTAELHRWADSAASIFYLGLIASLVLVALRPQRRTGLAAWAIGLVALMAALSVPSTLMQQHAGLVGALRDAAIMLVVLAGPLLAFAPHRGSVVRGGRSEESALTPRQRLLFAGGALAFAAVAVAAVVWRLAGGTVESPREDDVISFVMFGVAGSFACWQALRRREGWRPLSWIALGLAAYAVLGSGSLLVAS